MSKTILITGANRGIGLELARQYIQNGDEVLACCRQPSEATQLKQIVQQGQGAIFQLDVTNEVNVKDLSQKLADKPIDILINNAGIYGESNEEITKISAENMSRVFATNVIGVVNVSGALLNNVIASQEKTIVVVTSKMGSITEAQGGAYTYRASKAAVNSITRTFAYDLKEQGVNVIAVHPGWVKTDMGGPNAPVDMVASATGIRNVVANKKCVTKNGFVDFQGKSISW